MENTYYKEWLSAQSEVERLKKENGQLKTTIESMDVEIRMLRLEVQGKVNEIIDLSLTTEDDCPCDKDCGCKGDDFQDCDELLP